jgi:hypothetical protein
MSKIDKMVVLCRSHAEGRTQGKGILLSRTFGLQKGEVTEGWRKFNKA